MITVNGRPFEELVQPRRRATEPRPDLAAVILRKLSAEKAYTVPELQVEIERVYGYLPASSTVRAAVHRVVKAGGAYVEIERHRDTGKDRMMIHGGQA